MARLTNAQRERAVGMLQGRISMRQVAIRLGCNVSTISRLQQRLRATGRVTDRRRPGQPRVTTARQDGYIRQLHLRNRFTSASATGRQMVGRRGPVSGRTVRRRLYAAGLIARRPYVGPILTQQHRQRRLRWATVHGRWTRQQWASVLFSDESRFTLSRSDGRARVWRRRGERYANCCVREADRWGGGGVMVWAAFSRDFRTPIHFFNGPVNAVSYQQVLQNHVIPTFLQHPQLTTFQQDNARPHTARATTAFLQVSVSNFVCFIAFMLVFVRTHFSVTFVCFCLCMCVIVCVYVFLFVFVCVRLCVFACACLCMCLCVFIGVFVCAVNERSCFFQCLCVCVCICVYMFMCVNMCFCL